MKKNTRIYIKDRRLLLTVIFSFVFSLNLFSQDLNMATDTTPVKKRAWNEINLGFTTARIGIGFIHEYAAYKQNETGKAQMDSAGVVLKDEFKFRDFRFFANGRFKGKREVIWKAAIMFDGVNRAWTFRETGLQIDLPELKSKVFVGRMKEGYSLNKVQNGYSTWGNERQMSLDLIPIMTDGIRWYGYLPKPKLFWSMGAFSDVIYENSRFATWDWQYSGRIGWRPIFTDNVSPLLHLGINFRYARPDDGKFRVRSKPESNPAPYFIDTGIFGSDHSSSIGGEAYYRKGPFMLGSEINWHYFHSAQAGNPTYPGGDFVLSYFLTGETRPYLSDNSVFYFIKPEKSLFKGGAGAWELVLHYSFFNTNKGLLPGGDLWKITPMINWYVNKSVRIEFVYGYGVLDRFNLKGATQFFQTRFQFVLM
ncbi:MAG: OprO/OprP family phosphate-selective porin [Cytophagaceae bacterium]